MEPSDKTWNRRGGKSRPAEVRFWEKVNKNGPEVHPDLGPCWLWRGGCTKGGYGQFKTASYTTAVYTHRWAYEQLVGPIPDGKHLDHLCRVRNCVNPAHLEAVSNRENTLRGVGPCAVHAAKTHCKNGHEFTPENTYASGNGGRRCRACNLEWQRQKRYDKLIGSLDRDISHGVAGFLSNMAG